MARTSKRLIASYILDWIIIMYGNLSFPPPLLPPTDNSYCSCIVALGAGLWTLHPNRRPFTLTDPSIAYPHVSREKITTATLFVVTVVAPLLLTIIITLLTPFPTLTTTTTLNLRSLLRTYPLKHRLRNLNTSLLSLLLSFALSFLSVQAMKNLFGRPRPDLLARCIPDYQNQEKYALGGYGDEVLNGFYLVSASICTQTDTSKLDDGFSSFPSGHATYAWAGMVYLALFVTSHFGYSVPLPPPPPPPPPPEPSTTPSSPGQQEEQQKEQPSLLLLLLPLIPLCVATYITTTRFSDFRHHPGDIIFGALLGTMFSVWAWRLYHRGLGERGNIAGVLGRRDGGVGDGRRKREGDGEEGAKREGEEGTTVNGGGRGV
ncbi:MAG: hypothetical protein Q9219_004416 [cf. Caloplaca sp. 3 TL-2023]